MIVIFDCQRGAGERLHEIALPDISTKEKAQAALGMDMKQMNSDKAQFLKTTVPAWDAEAKAAGRLAQ